MSLRRRAKRTPHPQRSRRLEGGELKRVLQCLRKLGGSEYPPSRATSGTVKEPSCIDRTAGIAWLTIDAAGVTAADVDKFIIAGAFGT